MKSELVRIVVGLDDEEKARVEAYSAPLKVLAPGGLDDHARIGELAQTAPGRTAIRMAEDARGIVDFCAAKRAALHDLLEIHRGRRVWIVAPAPRHAYAIAAEHLVPMITSSVSAKERSGILEKFQDGRVMTVVADRAGFAVDAEIGIVLAGERRAENAPRWSVLYELVCDVDDGHVRAVA